MISLRLAVRSVGRNKRRSLIVAGAAAVGAFVLTLAAAFVSGTSADMRTSIIHGGRGHFEIAAAHGFDGYTETQLEYALTPSQVAKVTRWTSGQKDIAAVAQRLMFGGLISNGPRTVGFSGTAVDPAVENRAFHQNYTLIAGHPLTKRSPPDSVIIGKGIADQLQLKVGSGATLLSTTGSGAINALDVTIAGIISTGTPQADAAYLQTSLKTGQALLATNRISRISILANSDEIAHGVQTSASKYLGADFEIRDWLRLTPLYKQIIAMYGGIFIFFGLTLCIVSGFTIAGAVLTSVLERTSEIGLMRALAIKGSTIRGMFVGEGAVLGFIGSMSGILLGMLATNALNSAHIMMPPPPGATKGYPLHLIWHPATGMILIAVFVGVSTLAAWAVSKRASRLTIMQAFAAE